MTWSGAPVAGHQAGTANISISASTNGSVTVTFPKAYPSAPSVTVSANSSNYNASWASVTATSVILSVRHIDATSSTGTVVVSWTADPA